jgi:hypothetical protein
MTKPPAAIVPFAVVAPCHYRRRVIVGADCVGCLPIVVRTAANEFRPGTPGAWSPAVGRVARLSPRARRPRHRAYAPACLTQARRDSPVRFFVSSVQSSGANRGPVAPSFGLRLWPSGVVTRLSAGQCRRRENHRRTGRREACPWRRWRIHPRRRARPAGPRGRRTPAGRYVRALFPCSIDLPFDG